MRRRLVLTAAAAAIAVVSMSSVLADASVRWSTFIGGTGREQVLAVATDQAANTYVTGITRSTDFPTTPGAAFETSLSPDDVGSLGDAYVTKFDRDGDIVWSTYLGGSSFEYGFGIAVDRRGQVYVTGMTGQLKSSEVPFPLTPDNAFQTEKKAYEAIFLSKIAADGSELLYSTLIDGSDNDNGFGITVDDEERVYLSARTHSSDLPVVNGFQSALKSPSVDRAGVITDTWIGVVDTKLAGASSLVYSSYAGGTLEEAIYGDYRPQSGVALTDDGKLVVTGHTSSPDFPTTPGAYQTTFAGVQDAFVMLVDPFAVGPDSLKWSTLLGGTLLDESSTVTIGADDTIYVGGQTLSPDLPMAASDPLAGGAGDAYLARLSADGSALLGVTRFNGTGADDLRGVAATPTGSIVLSGVTAGGLPGVEGHSGGNDAFHAELSQDLSLISAGYLGGAGEDEAWGIAFAPGLGYVVAGGSDSADLPERGDRRAYSGGIDGFTTVLR